MKIGFYGNNSEEPSFINFLVESKDEVGSKELEIEDLKERYDDGYGGNGTDYMPDLQFDLYGDSELLEIVEYLDGECDGNAVFNVGDVRYEAFYVDYHENSTPDFDELLDFVAKKVGFHDLKKYRKYILTIEFSYPDEL